jgi:flagellar biogenesis protein FliO
VSSLVLIYTVAVIPLIVGAPLRVQGYDTLVASNESVSLDVADADMTGIAPSDENKQRIAQTAAAPTQSRASDAQDGGPKRRVQRGDGRTSSESSSVTSWRRSLLPLAVVLGLIGLGAWLVKRWLPMGQISRGGPVRVVAQSVLAPRHTAVLVQLGRRLVLVGVSGERMSRLCEITDPDEVLELLSGSRSAADGGRAFDSLLGRESITFQDSSTALRTEREDREDRKSRSEATPAPVAKLLTRLRALQNS